MKNPYHNDQVYKSLQKLFKHQCEINLNRENKTRFTIRNLAKKRFLLGYPPRKNSDSSIGDAINWEWLIACAQNTGKHIIIVTRDSDFGCTYDNESYLNDWLMQEFKQRVSQRRKIILTNRLSYAFQLVKIPVTNEMIEEEKSVIKWNYNPFISSELQDSIFKLNEQIESLKFNDGLELWAKRLRELGIKNHE